MENLFQTSQPYTNDRFTCPEQNHEYMLSISDFLIL